MHKSFGWMTLFLVAAGSASARDAASDQRELLKADAAVCSAFESGDAKALGGMLDATFTLTSSRGEVTNRAQNLDEVARRDPYYDVFRNHDQHVRLYGDAAIITGITTVKGRSGGDAFAADFQFTDTWIHRDGRWTLAASHASKLPENPLPADAMPLSEAISRLSQRKTLILKKSAYQDLVNTGNIRLIRNRVLRDSKAVS